MKESMSLLTARDKNLYDLTQKNTRKVFYLSYALLKVFHIPKGIGRYTRKIHLLKVDGVTCPSGLLKHFFKYMGSILMIAHGPWIMCKIIF